VCKIGHKFRCLKALQDVTSALLRELFNAIRIVKQTAHERTQLFLSFFPFEVEEEFTLSFGYSLHRASTSSPNDDILKVRGLDEADPKPFKAFLPRLT